MVLSCAKALVLLSSVAALASSSAVETTTSSATTASDSFLLAANGSTHELIRQQTVSRQLAADGVYSMCGVDLPGFDISNQQRASPDACARLCSNSVAGCDAVTWTNHNGGTCWFKRLGGADYYYIAKPKTGAASYVKTPSWTVPQDGLIDVFSGVDMPGNDIGSQRQASWCGCPQACRANGNCFAFTWTDHQGGTCWLKSKGGNLVGKSGRTISSTMIKYGYIGTCRM